MKKKEILKEQKKIRNSKNDVLIDFSLKSDVKKVGYIIGGVLIFITVIFVMVNIFNGTWKVFNRNNDKPVEFDSSLLMCGTMFAVNDNEYLVLAYHMDLEEDGIYSMFVDQYKGKLPLYYLDLDSGFNKSCVGSKNNLVNDVTKIKFKTQALLHIKNKRIIKTYTNKEMIKNYFIQTNK